jgi:hypothetical protein
MRGAPDERRPCSWRLNRTRSVGRAREAVNRTSAHGASPVSRRRASAPARAKSTRPSAQILCSRSVLSSPMRSSDVISGDRCTGSRHSDSSSLMSWTTTSLNGRHALPAPIALSLEALPPAHRPSAFGCRPSSRTISRSTSLLLPHSPRAYEPNTTTASYARRRCTSVSSAAISRSVTALGQGPRLKLCQKLVDFRHRGAVALSAIPASSAN